MARKMFDNLSAIVADTLTDSIKMIHIDDLHESADNFFVVERIEEFAQTILGQGGVKDNLLVRPLPTGGYEVISGHRRCAAVRFLINQGANISQYLPCLIQEYEDEDSKMLDLILMNVSARQISDAELWQCYETIDRILQAKKEKGEYFGRIREQIAETLGVSPAQVGKLQNVERNAIDAVKQAVAAGEISISTANEIAKLDNEQQEELAQGDLSEVKHKEVKHRQSASKTPKVDTYINDHADVDIEDDPENEVDTYINGTALAVKAINVQHDGLHFLTIYGTHASGSFVALPEWGISAEVDSDFTDIENNAEAIAFALRHSPDADHLRNIQKAAMAIATTIYEGTQ